MKKKTKKEKELDDLYEKFGCPQEDFKVENPNKEFPMFEGLLKYFPNALREVSNLSLVANNQHHPDKPLHWDKNKSTDEKDALLRHLTEIAKGNDYDTDGQLHAKKVAWRALANLERELTK